LNDAAIRASFFLFLKVGDRRYLDEADELIDAYEELLGPSVETVMWRASSSQLKGDHEATVEACRRAQGLLERAPSARTDLQIGLCLASEPGHEDRGIEIAEAAAVKLKDPQVYLLLVALLEEKDAVRARTLRERADHLARGASPERLDADLDGFRDLVQLERDHLAALAHRRKGS
jgi:hypothetical protein